VSSAGSGAIITSAERTKLSGIATGAEVNVNADWNASSGDAQILNKPTLFSGAYADLTGKPTLATVATSGSYSDLSGTPSIPSAIGDLSDVPASLGTAGQVLAVNSGGTALEYVAQSGGGGGGATLASAGKFIMWAEENGALSPSTNSGYQWSWGNGDTPTVGLAIPFDCTVTAMIFNCVTNGTSATINLHKGTSATSTTSSSIASITVGAVKSAVSTLGAPVALSAGEWITFRTTQTSGTYDDARVGIVVQYDIGTSSASIGDLSDVPATMGTTGQVLVVDSAGTALEYGSVTSSPYEEDALVDDQNVTMNTGVSVASNKIVDIWGDALATPASATAKKMLGFHTGSGVCVLRGMVDANGSISGATAGSPLWLDAGGAFSATAPTTATHYSRVVGYFCGSLIGGEVMCYFDPSKDWVQID
jgi:hypothetical protein